VESKNGQKTGVFHRRCSVENGSGSNGKTRAPEPAAALPECRPAPERWGSRRNCFVKNVKNRQKIRAACPKQLWRTCGKRKKAENFAKKFAGGLDK